MTSVPETIKQAATWTGKAVLGRTSVNSLLTVLTRWMDERWAKTSIPAYVSLYTMEIPVKH